MQGWKTENCSSLPKELEMVNASTYIQRRNITRVERDSCRTVRSTDGR